VFCKTGSDSGEKYLILEFFWAFEPLKPIVEAFRLQDKE
jgi:hypothetical protein